MKFNVSYLKVTWMFNENMNVRELSIFILINIRSSSCTRTRVGVWIFGNTRTRNRFGFRNSSTGTWFSSILAHTSRKRNWKKIFNNII